MGRPPRHGTAAAAMLVLLTTAVGIGATSSTLVRAAIALPATVLLIAICLRSPRRSVLLLLVWLAVLGTLRRLLLFSGASGGNDPLLLVSPLAVGLLVLVATRKGALQNATAFTKTVLLLSGLVLAAALNPLQGGIAVGVGGLLFIFVPMMWFWIGRGLVDDQLLTRVLRVVALLSLGGAIYGLLQVYIGLPSWDSHWVDVKGYQALHVGDSVRPFAFFTSSSEYVGFLMAGMLIWALRLRGGDRLLPAAALFVTGWALVLASARGALVILPVALGVTFAASRGFGIVRTAIAGVAGLFLLAGLISAAPSAFTGDDTSALLSHQVNGLADPFNPQVSTLPIHVNLMWEGLKQGFRNPIGSGLGSVTIAAEKFGNFSTENVTTEADPSNVAVAMGLPGLVTYLATVVLGLRLAFRRARSHRDFLTLAAFGILLVTLLQWLNGGNYSLAPLPWLMLGWFDRPSSLDLRSRATAMPARVATGDIDYLRRIRSA